MFCFLQITDLVHPNLIGGARTLPSTRGHVEPGFNFTRGAHHFHLDVVGVYCVLETLDFELGL